MNYFPGTTNIHCYMFENENNFIYIRLEQSMTVPRRRFRRKLRHVICCIFVLQNIDI